ncbi:villin-3 isoform X1 [Physcomitrium patens]|uniref:HP domain-containing protein n=1 Tax=Physcomitrium patens TaxID=3218 RepID=A0A2K1J080_PHYPA|nr:villin-3-like isoform X1 [Physcomitrium patens]XP_024402890.1 villin-3-like isoform X1 [Physcomitrium patens]XP_024402891.1 villin-3-like isoform X1 [Physcomitrium patens]XP_024402892.1 villin-3-like isoform X1 [Physcomitrium patens]PNR34935.1 hypothetical protein PHYPA_022834 [Physcomitrium patens]|eukprot:XP_024402888.1 villin-3-like isoform X1 [Physcomitrella patens]
MAVSMKNVDIAFQGVGQKPGMEIWRIEDFKPTPLPTESYGKFYSGDSYIVLRTTALKTGGFHYDIHFWLGKNTTQDEAGTAAIKTVELDAALGGRAVQYRETQEHETDLFLSYFKPCIIPLEGGVASGFNKVEVEKVEPRLFIVKGRRAVRVSQVPFARSSLNHNDVFVLDTESTIFQFNGATSSIQERGKALEVVQYIKDTYHDGKCEVIIIDDGTLGSEADTGQFWVLFGGFAPLARKAAVADDAPKLTKPKLFCIIEASFKEVEISKDILDSSKCYLLDCGNELYIWAGRNTSLDARKAAVSTVENFITNEKRPKHSQIIRIIEGFETLEFRSHFDNWPLHEQYPISEEGRGKVAALLKQQGLNTKGILKGSPVREESPSLPSLSGKLEVWRIVCGMKKQIAAEEIGRFYENSCYIVLYTYQGEERKEEYLLCNWSGRHSPLEDKDASLKVMKDMSVALKGRAVQAYVAQGREPIQFLALFKCMCILKEPPSLGQKDNNAVMLVRVRAAGPKIVQAVQVEPSSASLNSSDCFLLQTNSKLYAWSGNLSTFESQKASLLVAEILKPGVIARAMKEGLEPPLFWSSLGGKRKYASQREARDVPKDPRLYACSLSQGNLKVIEVHNFTQDDLLTEDIMILDCHNIIYEWIGHNTSTDNKEHSLSIAKRFLERAEKLDGAQPDTPIFILAEGYEPIFFTSFFSWDSSKVNVNGDAYSRKLAGLQGRRIPSEKPQRHLTSSSSVGAKDESTQRAAAMAALSSQLTKEGKFSKVVQNIINQNNSASAPVSPRFHRPSTANSQRAAAMAALSLMFGTKKAGLASSVSVDSDWIAGSSPFTKMEASGDTESVTSSKSEDGGDEGEEITEFFSYDRLKASPTDPDLKINVKRKEAYLSPEDFEKLFGMPRSQFYELPKWKQDQRKRNLQLF